MPAYDPFAFGSSFRDLKPLAQTPRAELWSAVDATGTTVHLVVLTAAAAPDPAARAVLDAAASGTSPAPGAALIAVQGADLAAERPWVAGPAHDGRADVDTLIEVLAGLPGRTEPAPAPEPTVQHSLFAPHQPVYPAVTHQPPLPVWRPPAAPAARRGVSGAALAAVVTAVVLLCGASAYGVYALVNHYGTPDPTPTPRPSRSSWAPRTPNPAPATTAPATTAPAPGADTKPVLKDVPPLRVLGPTYSAGESTYTMDFAGWPFAFRTPGTWGCLGGRVALPDTQARVCIDEGNPGAKHRVGVALRACAKPCSAATRSTYVSQWYDRGTTVRTWDPRTTYAEGRTPSGLYELDLCRFFGATRGAAPTWQVCVTASAPDATKATVQKVVNEIVSQTP